MKFFGTAQGLSKKAELCLEEVIKEINEMMEDINIPFGSFVRLLGEAHSYFYFSSFLCTHLYHTDGCSHLPDLSKSDDYTFTGKKLTEDLQLIFCLMYECKKGLKKLSSYIAKTSEDFQLIKHFNHSLDKGIKELIEDDLEREFYLRLITIILNKWFKLLLISEFPILLKKIGPHQKLLIGKDWGIWIAWSVSDETEKEDTKSLSAWIDLLRKK